MTATAARLTTFAELEQLPDSPFGRYELHNGELVTVAPPKHEHKVVQRKIRRILEAVAGEVAEVDSEYGFRPAAEHEYRVAGIALVSRERWDRISGYLFGAPDLVVEVLSPSKTASEMYEKERICLQNGGLEFWVVDPKRREVRVTTSTGTVHYYTPADQIPLYFGASIPVASLFE